MHAAFTDVWYVLKGSGTLVTGGTIVGGVETAPGEVRGRTIVGGDSRLIRAGDFAVVPAGAPHCASRVGTKELLHFVVRVPHRADGTARMRVSTRGRTWRALQDDPIEIAQTSAHGPLSSASPG